MLLFYFQVYIEYAHGLMGRCYVEEGDSWDGLPPSGVIEYTHGLMGKCYVYDGGSWDGLPPYGVMVIFANLINFRMY